MNEFKKLGISESLLSAISNLGITEPTKIQRDSIPHILEGKDVIGGSATGSGKTLAFGSGVIEKAIPRNGLQSLILTPTRELAEQVKSSLRELSKGKKLSVIAVYGGVSINPQIDALRKADVVVGTPGRVLDHLERRTINLSKVNIVVLDEADRMLDMGFIDDVEKIIRSCPKERQTLLFSATMSDKIVYLANKYTKKPIKVSAEKQVDPSKLKQFYYDIDKNKKLSLMVHLLENEESGLAMVFCNTRKTADFIMKNFRANNIKAISIHGGLTQNKRTKNIELFNKARTGVLVCTDVAARGLHIENVSHVYNYEIPSNPKDYVHRIGRTARAGEQGKVINLLSNFDHDNFSRILQEYRNFMIKKMNQPELRQVKITKFEGNNERERRFSPRGRRNFRRN